MVLASPNPLKSDPITLPAGNGGLAPGAGKILAGSCLFIREAESAWNSAPQKLGYF